MAIAPPSNAASLVDGRTASFYTQFSGQPTLDALLGGVKWGGALGTGATVTFAFPQQTAQFDGTAQWGYYGAGTENLSFLASSSFRGFNVDQANAARAVLASYAAVVNLNFVDVLAAPGVGQIRYAVSGSPALSAGTFAISDFPMLTSGAGDTWVNAQSLFPGGWAAGTQNYFTLLHETGHDLGLKHPHDQGYAGYLAGWPQTLTTLPTLGGSTLRSYGIEDTVMAYNDVAGTSSVRADFAPTTPMRLDIAALQYVYGANWSYHAGDDVYRFTTDSRVNQTIWDAGGNDTIAVSGSGASLINLTPGSWSEIGLPLTYSVLASNLSVLRAAPQYTNKKTLYIYDTVTIENAVGGDGPDTLIGNAGPNRLTGGGGDDRLDGGAGVDTAVCADAAFGATLARQSPQQWSLRTASGGSDTLVNMERIEFSDRKLALDLDGAAGTVAKLAGALFGAGAVADAGLIGLGLAILDQGFSAAQLAQAAVQSDAFGARAGSHGSADFVATVYANLMGVAPDAETAAAYTAQLDAGGATQASLALAAAELEPNLANIGYTGLSQTGLWYV